MGVLESPDIAQEFMENLLRDLLEEIVVYIDELTMTGSLTSFCLIRFWQGSRMQGSR